MANFNPSRWLITAIPRLVGKPENLAAGQRMADEAVALVRDNSRVLPLLAAGTTGSALPYQSAVEVRNHLVVIIFSEDLRTDSGRMLERQILARVPDAHVLYVDPRSAAGMSGPVIEAVDAAEKVVAAVYVIPTAGRAIPAAGGLTNTVSMADANGALLNAILTRAANAQKSS